MASKSGQQEPEKAEVIEELLDGLDTTLDRVKVLYEQYFLGIQKQPPTYLHTDAERKIRELAQIQIRNTAMRYRFATLQQKYGAYNSYWRRTLRQIENGTYTRNLYKVGRQAAKTGAAVPEEILAAMPKRMRDQVIRDREAALAMARLRERPAHDDDLLTLADEEVEINVDDLDPAAFVHEPSDVRRNALTAAGAHRVDEADADFDVDAFFASVIQDDAPSRDTLSRPAVAEPPGDAAEPARRSSRSSSRPPGAARTATGHPRPGSASGSPVAAGLPGDLRAGRRPITKRPPTDEGAIGPGGPMRKVTGSMRTVRPPSSPGLDLGGPRRTTGRIQTVRPPPGGDTEPQLSIPSPGAASPAAATRKITGPMRAVRPPSSPDPEPEPASGPAGGAATPSRAPAQTTSARPLPAGDTGPRLVIPSLGSTTPAAPTRRITPPARAAVGPPSDLDPEPASSSTARPSIEATGERHAVAAPAHGAAPTASESAGHDASAFAPESTQRARPAAIPDIPPMRPGGAAARPATPSGARGPLPPPAAGLDPARTAPSQATKPLRVAPGAAAAHVATPVETLAGPFPRIPSPPKPRAAGAPPEPPPIPAPPFADRAPAPPRGPAPSPAPLDAPSPASSPAPSSPAAPAPTTPGGGAAPAAGDVPRPAPRAARRTPPAMPAVTPSTPSTPSKRGEPPRPGAGERPPEARQAPPPGMTDADVNALYAKYVKAKQILGEEAEPGTYGKLLKTITAQAPKIMAQYKASGVDFSVVVKDNQVIIRAKPKP